MKVQIDIENKIVRIEESVNLEVFFTEIKRLLSFRWKEFTLEVTVIKEYTNPIVIEPYTTPLPDYPNPITPSIPSPSYPNPYTTPDYPQYPWFTYCSTVTGTDQNMELVNGVYNIELKI